MSNGKWLTHLIHDMNHSQILRSCTLNSNNIGKSIINLAYNSSGIYTNLNPGIYRITINNVQYCFDLYIPIKGDSILYIKNIYNAYAAVLTNIYPIILYKVLSSNSDNINKLNNTINDYIDMIVMDGITEIQTDEYNITDNLKKLVSISNISIKTSSKQINIELKEDIKSLPNNICDTLILNAELYNYHLILRVGKKYFTGEENWQYIKSGEHSHLFFLEDSSIKFENSNNNMISSHFSTNYYTTIISNDFNYDNGIATSHDNTYSNGIFVRVPKDLIDSYYKEESFKKWISNQLLAKRPFIIEYPLSNYIYKTYLLDEYHIYTTYPTTLIEIDNKYNISYFYKTLNS